MKILLTGATGFIGSNLAKKLAADGHDLLYTSGSGKENIVQGNLVCRDFCKIDFTNLPNIDVLFHQAAITDTLVRDKKEMMRVNCHESINLFEKSIKAGCKNIVYASSCAVYGNVTTPFKEDGPKEPLNEYAESKLELDKIAQSIDKAIVIGLRYSNVYGPGEEHKKHYASMVYKLAKQVHEKQNPILYEWGEQKRDIVYVEDVVRLNLAAMKAKKNGVYNGGSGKATSYNEIIELLQEFIGVKKPINYIKNPVEANFQNLTWCDMSRSKEDLGHEVKYDAKNGIKDFVERLSF